MATKGEAFAGLTVALLTLVPYNYLITKVDRAVRDMEKYITTLEIFCQKAEIENGK